MLSFNEYVTEAVNKGKEVSSFDYTVHGEKLKFTINKYRDEEFRLNIDGTEKNVATLTSDSVNDAKAELKKILTKVGEDKFLSVINKNKQEVELKKNDTDWEVFSHYNTTRGSMAFIVYRRMSSGRWNWKQAPRGKKNLDMNMISKEDEVKKEIADTVKKSKLKHVEGWNPETDK